MIDPISIVAASTNLISFCAKLSDYINHIQNVHTTVEVLNIEINSLAQVLISISTNFSDPSLAQTTLEKQIDHEGKHWHNLRYSMDDCKRTLDNLTRTLEYLNSEGGFCVVQ